LDRDLWHEASTDGLRTKKREFDDSKEAIKYAQRLIDEALNQHFGAAKSAHELMTLYAISGSDDPKIYGEPHVDFHAYRYARDKADAMFALPANGLRLWRASCDDTDLLWRSRQNFKGVVPDEIGLLAGMRPRMTPTHPQPRAGTTRIVVARVLAIGLTANSARSSCRGRGPFGVRLIGDDMP